MKYHIKSLFFCVVLFSSSLLSDNYQSLHRPFQRDVIFLIDWDSELESLSYTFHTSQANLPGGLGSVALSLAAGLYNPAVPIVVSTSTWRTLLERAQFMSDSNALTQKQFVDKYYNNYKNKPDFQNTLLIDQGFLAKLYRFCKKSLQTYNQVNAKIANEFGKTSDIKQVSWNVSEAFRDPTLGGFLTPGDMPLWKGVNDLLKSYIVIQKVTAEQGNWIIRQPDPCVYLMIPKPYLEGVKKQVGAFAQRIKTPITIDLLLQNSVKDKQRNRFLTRDEIILGLKFENWPSIANPFAIPAASCQEKQGSAISDKFIRKQGKIFAGIVPQIFLNANDFATFTEEQFLQRGQPAWIPYYCVWNVYGLGHGSPPQLEAPEQDAIYYVMGLREKAIEAFLDFFDSINTRFLYYTSCYAGGQRLRSLYLKEEQGRVLKKKYDYTIVAGAIAQVATIGIVNPLDMPPYLPPYGLVSKRINKQKQFMYVAFYTNFNAFFNDLHVLTKEKKPIPYKDILLHLEDFVTSERYANIPQIRFAGSAWFNVIDLPKDLLRLTKTFVKAKEAEINLAQQEAGRKLVIKNKKIVLIDAERIWQTLPGYAHSEIPFALQITGSMPMFISMVSGNAWHGLEKIEARTLGFLNVVKALWGVPGTFNGRTYYIKDLIVKNDLKPQQAAAIGAAGVATLALKNVYIFANAPGLQDYQIYKTVTDTVGNYFAGKQINLNTIAGLVKVLTGVGLPQQVANNIAVGLQDSFNRGILKTIKDVYRIILQNSLGKRMQGVTFMYKNALYAAQYSLSDIVQENNAQTALSQGLLPNLQNIAGPLPSYQELIATMFPGQQVPQEPSLEPVVAFIMDRKKQQQLLKEYEKKKAGGKKVLGFWKKNLKAQERTFIENYEASLAARESQVPINQLLAKLQVELQMLASKL